VESGEVDKMKNKQEYLCEALESEIVGASALMETEQLLDTKSADYVQGFMDGFASCLKLAERFDAISSEKDEELCTHSAE
jgi:hypothetical protein